MVIVKIAFFFLELLLLLAFSSCGELGLLFIAVGRLLILVASSTVEHRL